MKIFRTLLWLEARKNRRILCLLLIFIGLWLVLIPQIKTFAENLVQTDTSQVQTTRVFLILTALGLPGVAGFLLMSIGFMSNGREARDGQLQFLLMTPPSPMYHVSARFCFLLGTSISYIGILVFSATLSYVAFSDFLAQFFASIVTFFYFVVTVLLPLSAAAVLTDSVLLGYRVQGRFVAPLAIMLTGVPALFLRTTRFSQSLSGLYLPALSLPKLVEFESFSQYPNFLPTEPLVILLILSGVLMFLAVSIWNKLEV